MTGLDIAILGVGCFCIGWIFGAMLLVYQARRPQGYVASNGLRVRLVAEPLSRT